MKIGGPIEALWTTLQTTARPPFPPMKIGGPIEAEIACGFDAAKSTEFPPMKIGGPIEAHIQAVTPCATRPFPPMKIGGPIEAVRPDRIWQ